MDERPNNVQNKSQGQSQRLSKSDLAAITQLVTTQAKNQAAKQASEQALVEQENAEREERQKNMITAVLQQQAQIQLLEHHPNGQPGRNPEGS
jgi:hypothetical protein